MTVTNKSRKMLLNYAICTSLLVAPAVAHADTIFSNFGPGFSYNTSLGNPIGDGLDGSGFNYGEGDSFTAGLNASLTSINIALGCAVCPSGGSLVVRLTQNAVNSPGTVLESFSILGSALGSLGNNNPLITMNSVLHPSLSAGTRYWITVGGPATSAIAWNWNTTGDPNAEAISGDGGASWFGPSGLTPGAFGVIGTPSTTVPEPGAIWMLTASVLGLGVTRHRWMSKRK